MTTIAIVAPGSRGDVQPYIALGRGLRDAGYDVRVLTSADFEKLVIDAGLVFCSMGMSTEQRIQTDEWRREMERGNFLSILKRMQKEMKRSGAEMAQVFPPLLRGSDIIITGMGGLVGTLSVTDQLRIPVILAYLFPFTPTREFPMPLVERLPFGRLLNRLSFRLMQQMIWQSFKVSDVAMRQALGMGKPPFWGPFGELTRRRVPVLYGYSSHVLPRPCDWPDYYHVTGYWFLDEPWQPPADLVDFLNAGAPPVYIGFGSMGSRNPEEAGRIALEALAKSGQRGILASGWGGLKSSDVPDNVHMVTSLPHSWLFPRMAAVVHHGGAGTTAASLRAGVPSVVVPFMGDQPFWGRRVAALGVGPAPIPRKQLTSQRLADTIRECVTNPAMRQKAGELGQRIRADDGIGAAVAIVKQIAK